MDNIRDILQEIGYTNISQMGDFYRCKPIYRSSSSSAPLSINKNTGYFTDFGTSETGNFNQLIMLSTGCSAEDAKKLTNREYTEIVREQRMTDIPIIFGSEEIKILLPSYYYFNQRGISTETLKHYKGGLATQGKMSDRFVFPIINRRGQLVGLSGRCVTGKREVRWKHLGRKSSWDYPYFFNKKELESANEIILVEGISDLLALHEAGIKNVLVLFGLSLGKELITTLLTLNKNIWICTNNDPPDENGRRPGVEAASKLKKELEKWFSEDRISVKLPDRKDFGCNSTYENIEWYKKMAGGRSELV